MTVSTARPLPSSAKEAALATCEAILDSGRKLFPAEGYAKVTVADIASDARVTVPTVYDSTGGKAAILEALLAPAVGAPADDRTLTGIAETENPRGVIAILAPGTRQAHQRHGKSSGVCSTPTSRIRRWSRSWMRRRRLISSP